MLAIPKLQQLAVASLTTLAATYKFGRSDSSRLRTVGNANHNILRGPPFYNVDLTVDQGVEVQGTIYGYSSGGVLQPFQLRRLYDPRSDRSWCRWSFGVRVSRLTNWDTQLGARIG